VTEPTDNDRQVAATLLDEVMTGGYSHDGANEYVARALIAQRDKGYQQGREDDRAATLFAIRKALDDLRDAVAALEDR
jgi:hypothetical protein